MAAAESTAGKHCESKVVVTIGQLSPYVFEHPPCFDFGELDEENQLKRIALRAHKQRSDSGDSGAVQRRVSFFWELGVEKSRSCPLYSEFGVKNFIACKFAGLLGSGDIQDVLQRGFRVRVNGKQYKYHFFGHSASQLRERECVLYNIGLGDRDKIQARFGNFQAIKQAHKRAARIGLLLSSAESKVWLTDSEIVLVDDVERNGYNFTDGCGMISVETANSLTEALDIQHLYDHQKVKVPSVFQVRLKGCKGVLALDPEVKHGIQIRPSMVKFQWQQSTETYPLRVVENGYSKRNDIGRINKQFIQLLSSLGVPDQVFERKQFEHMRNVEQLLINQEVAILYLSAFGQSGLAEKLVTCGINGEVQQHLKKMKREIKQGGTVSTPDQKPRSKAEKLQIPIEQSRLVFGICDNTGSLQYGQCFFQPTIRGHPQVIVETNVVVGRSPSHHPGDLRVLSCVDVPKCHHLVDCVVFPVNGDRPHADEMSGGDLDGDKFFVCWDKELIPSTIEQPCSYTVGRKAHRGPKSHGCDPMVTLFANYNQRTLGHVDRLFNEWANARGAGSGECKWLSELSSLAVDAAKTDNQVKIPKALLHPPTVSVSKFIWQKMEDKAKLFVEDQLMSELGCEKVNHVSMETMMEVISDLTGTMSDYWLFRLAWKWWNMGSGTAAQFVELTNSIDFSNMTLQQRQLVMVDVTSVGASTPLISQPVVFNALYRSEVFSQEDLVCFGLDKHGSGWRCLKSLSANSLTPAVMASILQFPQPKLLIFEFMLAGLCWVLGLFFSGSFSFGTQETVLDLKDMEECYIVALLSIHTGEPIREIQPIPSSYSLMWENGIFQLYERTKHNTFVFMDVGVWQPLASVALNRFKGSLKQRAPAKLKRESSGQLEVYAWTKQNDQLPRLLCQFENESNETVELDSAEASNSNTRDFTILEDDFPKLGEEAAAYIRQAEKDLDNKIQQATQLLSEGKLTIQQLEKLVAMMNMNNITKDDATVLACHIEHFLFEGKLSLRSSQDYLTVLLSLLYCSGLNGYHQNEPLFRVEKWANGSRVDRLMLGMQHSDVTFTLNELHYLLEYILYACNITVASYVLELLYGGGIPLSSKSGSPVVFDYYTKWVALLTLEMVEEIANSRAQSKYAKVTLLKDSDRIYNVHIQTPKFVVGSGDALLLSPLSGSATEYYVMQVTEPGDRIITVKQLWPSHDETPPSDGEWRARCQAGTVTYNRELEALAAIFSYDLETKAPSPVFSSVLHPTSLSRYMEAETGNGGSGMHEVVEDELKSASLPDITRGKIKGSDCPNKIEMQKFELDIFTSQNPVPITLVQGPPGTGKTRTAACIASYWYSNSKEPILLTAETNEGVDNLIEKVVQLGTIDGADILRLGRDEKIKDRSYEYSFECKYEHKHKRGRGFDTELAKRIVNKACVVCTTCIGAGVSLLKDRWFTRVLIDEACQATEPAALVPLMYGCTELVLVGDDKQLPPLVKSERAAELGISLFKRLSNFKVPVYLLDTQYRMHPDIAEYPSLRFYAGQLKNGVTERERPVPRGFVWPCCGSPLAFVHIEGEERTIGSSKENEAEAEEVCKIVQFLIDANGVQPGEIGIITPYKAQEACITRSLCSSVSVKTVDGFQGQEKEVIIFSTVRSNEHGNKGFLEDKSRFNVALTRARRGLIVVGNSKTLSEQRQDESSEWNKWINWMKGKGYWTDKTCTQMASFRSSSRQSGRAYNTGSGRESTRGRVASSSWSRGGRERGGSSSHRGYGRGGDRRPWSRGRHY